MQCMGSLLTLYPLTLPGLFNIIRNFIWHKKELRDAYFALKDYKNCAASIETCLEMSSLREAHSPKTTTEIYNTIGNAYYRIKNYPESFGCYTGNFFAFHPNEITAILIMKWAILI